MKHLISIFIFFTIGICTAWAQPATKSITIEISNPLARARANEPVVIPLHDVGFPVAACIVKDGAAEIPSQLDDLNQDDIPDELAFVVDVPAKGKKSIRIQLLQQGEQAKYTPRVYAHMKINDKNKRYPRVTMVSAYGDNVERGTYDMIEGHGVSFESEINAFRIYFDNRQSIDLYGKVHQQLELAETDFHTTNYNDKGYGSDVLWAGKAIGLGSFRGFANNQATTIDTVAYRSQAILANGPVRTIIEVGDKGWQYQGATLNMKQRYILYAAHRDVEVQVSFNKPLQQLSFCTGAQMLETDNEGFVNDSGLCGSWGSNIPTKTDSLCRPEIIGLGVCVPYKYVKNAFNDGQNYLITMGNYEGTSLSYHFTFCARKEQKGFVSSKEWFHFLENWQEQLKTPCTIHIKK